jgi:hypothetical protein
MYKAFLAALSVPAIALVVAGPANADDENFLDEIRHDYFTHSFTNQGLLLEGHKICDLAGRTSDDALQDIARSDLGISQAAASEFVDMSHTWLVC